MNQKLSDWANIAEILSGVAVVVTLVILIFGIRENTEITRASMYENHLVSLEQLSSDVYRDPDLTRIYEAWLSADLSGLDELDEQRLEQMQGNLFRTYERAYLAQAAGIYGSDESERMERLTCINYARAVLTRTSRLLDALMTSRFNGYVRETCPKVVVRDWDRTFGLLEVEERSRLQERVVRLLQSEPAFYASWREQRESLSGAFNTWLDDIVESVDIE